MKIDYQKFGSLGRQYYNISIVTVFAIGVFATCCSVANAQSTSWTDPGGGLWHDGSNWNNGVPEPDDSAFFNLNAPYFVFWNELIGDRSIQSAHFSSGQVALFNTDNSRRHVLTLTGAAGLPALSVSDAATFHGLYVENTGGGFVNSGGRLTISGGHEQGTELRNSEYFRYDGTTDIFGAGARLVNVAGAGIGSGSFGGATTATMTVRDDAYFHTQGSLYVGRDAAGSSTKRGDLNVMSGGRVTIGFFDSSNSTTNGNSFFVDGASSTASGHLYVDNTSTISVDGNSAVGSYRIGRVDLEGGSTWTTTGRLSIGRRISNVSTAVGRIDVLSGSQLISDTAHVGGDHGRGVVIVRGQDSMWQTRQLTVGGSVSQSDSGSGRLTISNGGIVTADDSVIIGDVGEIAMHNGRLEFNQMHINSLLRIEGTSGSLSGTVFTDSTRDIRDFGVLNDQAFETSDVQILNDGVIHGNGELSGRVQNAGTLLTQQGGQLRFIGGATNEGLINNAGNRVRLDAGLINNAGATVIGHGGFITGGIDNSGLMGFSGGQTFVFGDVNNMSGGRIVADVSSTISFRDAVIHNGEEFKVGQGTIARFQDRVSGASDFTGTGIIVFEDIFAPGNSIGILSIENDVELAAGSLLEIELGGLAFGEFDHLQIAGDLEIAGSLSVLTIGGFGLNDSHEFLIASIDGTRTGEFDGLGEGDFVGNFGRDLFISYQAGDGNDISLSTAVPEPNAASLLLLLGSIGLSRSRKRRVAQRRIG